MEKHIFLLLAVVGCSRQNNCRAKRRSFKHDLYDYRKETIELLFQRIIQSFDLKTCQVKGQSKNGAFVLASVWLYQIVFLMNLRQNKPLFVIKELIESVRRRIQS